MIFVNNENEVGVLAIKLNYSLTQLLKGLLNLFRLRESIKMVLSRLLYLFFIFPFHEENRKVLI